MAGKIVFYQRIIESMNEGIMALDPKGRITMFNDPAGEILGIGVDAVLNKPFGQVFMVEMEDNDAFSQVVMDAVYDPAVGRTDTLEFKRTDGMVRVLSLSTSYLKPEEAGGAETGGVVVVFNDITEITQSRQKEDELNLKLRNAFIDAEKTNKQLESALKKVQWIRMVVTLIVILGFAGMGYTVWQKDLLPGSTFFGGSSATESGGTDSPRASVTIRPLNSSISLSGFVAPLEEINVTAPFDGKIKERFFVYDQRVEKGDKLFTMDTDKLEVEFRNAKAAFIKAEQNHKGLLEWAKSADVSSSRRSFTKTQNSLDEAKRKLEENTLLFEKGIISRTELKSSESDYVNQKMDYTAARENLDAVMEKGSAANLEIAKMELANARASLEEVREKLKKTVVVAPVSGIIIMPTSNISNDGGQSKRVDAGTSVTQGGILVSVGNLDGLSVRAEVDEIDIGKIGFDMKVRVSGDAFSDMPMTGYVRQISSNAKNSGMDGPMFEVVIAIDKLTKAQKDRIRLGMSANLEIQVYENAKAMMVPLAAVEIRGSERWVQKPGKEGGVQAVRVTTGMTTLNEVEILSGLSPGDTVLLEPGAGFGDGPIDSPGDGPMDIPGTGSMDLPEGAPDAGPPVGPAFGE